MVGINHQTADISVRERVAFSPANLEGALQEACQAAGLDEVAILSTCNRTEVFAVGPAEEPVAHQVLAWLAAYHHISPDQLESCHYSHHGRLAIQHMMRVAAGLDSMILGEPQILGQMKDAYQHTQSSQTSGPLLHRAFQHAFQTAKQVRTETEIGQHPVSVAYAAVHLARQIFAQMENTRVLLVGAGETIELVGRHLKEQGIRSITVVNRTFSRAQAVANPLHGTAAMLSELPSHLPSADMVISSTASTLPILGKGTVERALKQRKHRPILMIDLAVPRDVEPEVADLDDVYLYTVDDLQEVVADNQRHRANAAREAERIIEAAVDAFAQSQQTRSAGHLIRDYRSQALAIQGAELERAKQLLAQGKDPEEVLQRLARNLTNKLIHGPSMMLKEMSVDGREELFSLCSGLLTNAEPKPPPGTKRDP